jgi:hypothetical protein
LKIGPLWNVTSLTIRVSELTVNLRRLYSQFFRSILKTKDINERGVLYDSRPYMYCAVNKHSKIERNGTRDSVFEHRSNKSATAFLVFVWL